MLTLLPVFLKEAGDDAIFDLCWLWWLNNVLLSCSDMKVELRYWDHTVFFFDAYQGLLNRDIIVPGEKNKPCWLQRQRSNWSDGVYVTELMKFWNRCHSVFISPPAEPCLVQKAIHIPLNKVDLPLYNDPQIFWGSDQVNISSKCIKVDILFNSLTFLFKYPFFIDVKGQPHFLTKPKSSKFQKIVSV